MDCFLAAKKVGNSGRVIGVDMTASMIDLARANARKFGRDNVEFRLGEIEALPIQDNSVDCVISNCVINLSTDKQRVFNEIFRVLRPGGRLAVSDLCLKQELPEEIKRSIMAYVGCVAGAMQVQQYVEMMEKAGFSFIDVVDSKADLNAYTMLLEDEGKKQSSACCMSACMSKKKASSSSSCPLASGAFGDVLPLLKLININDYAGSYKVYAVKPLAQ